MKRCNQWYARLAPVDQDIVSRDEQGRLVTERWPSGSFTLERENPSRVAVLVAHNPDLEVSRLDRLYEQHGWLCCAFRLRDDPLGTAAAEQIKIGTNVSISARIVRVGATDVRFFDEISLVPQGAYRGADIIDRLDGLPWWPIPTPPIPEPALARHKPSPPAPRAPSDPPGAGGGTVIHGGPVVRRTFKTTITVR